ncbi:hypothetical protein HK102_001337, partial [Quaeritorhiza haematococci]
MLRLPGRLNGPRQFTSDGFELFPVTLYNANNHMGLDEDSFLESLEPVGNFISPNGLRWVPEDGTWDDVLMGITFPDGTP